MRELFLLEGNMEQFVADDYVERYLPIVQPANGKVAYQLYQVDVTFDEVRLELRANAHSSIGMMLSTSNTPNPPNDIHLMKQSMVLSTAAAAAVAAPVSTSFSWKAPTSLMIARANLYLEFFSSGTGQQNILYYKIFYKKVAITELQYLQMMRQV